MFARVCNLSVLDTVQWATMLAVEQGQRWRCRTYSPRSTVIVPYSSTESVNTVPLKEGHNKESLIYFRYLGSWIFLEQEMCSDSLPRLKIV